MRKGAGGEHCLVFSIREREAGRHRSQGTMPAQPARLPLA